MFLNLTNLNEYNLTLTLIVSLAIRLFQENALDAYVLMAIEPTKLMNFLYLLENFSVNELDSGQKLGLKELISAIRQILLGRMGRG